MQQAKRYEKITAKDEIEKLEKQIKELQRRKRIWELGVEIDALITRGNELKNQDIEEDSPEDMARDKEIHMIARKREALKEEEFRLRYPEFVGFSP